MKRDAVACAFVFVRYFLEFVSAKNWQNWMTSDSVITDINRVTFFLKRTLSSFASMVCHKHGAGYVR